VPTLEVFADIACPFTHVGLRRIVAEREQRNSPLQLRVHAWPLEWVNGVPLDPLFVAEEVAALRATVAPHLFAGFNEKRFPHTSIPAFGLAQAAHDLGAQTGEAVSLAIRTALFEEGRDPSDDAVLASIASRFGLDVPTPDEAEASARAGWEEGRARGVQGSPHFFVGDASWFCPVLRIERDDAGDLHIQEDEETEHVFFATIFAAA
jgi:predicted DsbA family dithiol-disulfide isomerase